MAHLNGLTICLSLTSSMILFHWQPDATGYVAKTSLYSFEGNYYIYLEYDDETMEDARKSDLYSVLSEFGVPSNMTIHRLEEYGNLVMDADVFSTIQTYFSA